MKYGDKGIYLALGSNKGDREKNISRALEKIDAHPDSRLVRVSSIYESAPWGMKDQPFFLNAACEIDSRLSPAGLLREIKRMEQDSGRKKTDVRWGPREIDIDIILYHDAIIETPDLWIPHRYLTERLFVLIPLLELDPEGIHPKTGISFKRYLENFPLEDRRKSCLLYARKT